MDFASAARIGLSPARAIKQNEDEQDLGGMASAYTSTGPSRSGYEANKSVLGTLADVGLSGLATVGNILDTPGSMVRDVMTWAPGGIDAQNPFDQLLRPWSSDNRVHGQELVESITGGGIDKDSWTGFGTGLALEIATDPLTYLSLGTSAVGKGGLAAARAGLTKGGKVRNVANKVAGKELGAETGRKLGRMASRMSTTVRDVIDNSLDDAAIAEIRMQAANNARMGLESQARQKAVQQGMSEGQIDAFVRRTVDSPKSSEFIKTASEQATKDAAEAARADAMERFLRAGGTPEMLDEKLGGVAKFSIPFISKKFGDKYPILRERLLGTTKLTPGELAKAKLFSLPGSKGAEAAARVDDVDPGMPPRDPGAPPEAPGPGSPASPIAPPSASPAAPTQPQVDPVAQGVDAANRVADFEVGGGAPPKDGLVPTIVQEGKIYYGQAGDTHADVIKRYKDLDLEKVTAEDALNDVSGFAGPDGRQLNREEALTFARKEIPAVDDVDGALDAADYNIAKGAGLPENATKQVPQEDFIARVLGARGDMNMSSVDGLRKTVGAGMTDQQFIDTLKKMEKDGFIDITNHPDPRTLGADDFRSQFKVQGKTPDQVIFRNDAPELKPGATQTGPKAFADISPRHKAFDEELTKFTKDGVLEDSTAQVIREIFRGSSLDTFERINFAPVKEIAIEGGGETGRQRYAAGAFVNSTGEIKLSRRELKGNQAKQLGVFTHELAHGLLARSAQKQIDAGVDVIQEFDELIKGGQVQEYFKANYSPQKAKYYSSNPHEAFAQLFSDVIIQKRTPPQAMESFIAKVKDAAIKMLNSIMGRKGLSAEAKLKVEAMSDLIGGFITPEQYTKLVVKDKAVSELVDATRKGLKGGVDEAVEGARTLRRKKKDVTTARVPVEEVLKRVNDPEELVQEISRTTFAARDEAEAAADLATARIKELQGEGSTEFLAGWVSGNNKEGFKVDFVDAKKAVDDSILEEDAWLQRMEQSIQKPSGAGTKMVPIDEAIKAARDAGDSIFDIADEASDTARRGIFKDRLPEGFYVKSAAVVGSAKQEVATAEQWKGMLRKGDVKVEELEDLGIDQFLKENPKPTRQQLLEHIEANTPRIELVDGGSIFSGHKIPGGDPGTYQEILIKLPSKSGLSSSQESILKSLNDKLEDGLPFNAGERMTYDELRKLKDRPNFKGKHWGQDNVVAHLRTDTVTLPNGKKSLRIQEVQSDWMQRPKELRNNELALDVARMPQTLADGRPNPEFKQWLKDNKEMIDRDYPLSDYIRTPASEARLKDQLKQIKEQRKVLNEEYDRVEAAGGPGSELDRLFDEEKALRIKQQRVTDLLDPKFTVPDGPFKKSWAMLAMKQVLRKAAEEGFDEVTLVKGSDIAQAVGGPKDELNSFYEIVSGDLKKYTKRWGSFEGESQFPTVVAGSVSRFEWRQASDDFFSANVGPLSATIERISDGRYVAQLEDDVVRNADGRFFSSLDEAKQAVQEFANQSIPGLTKNYTGDVKVFKITDKMREDLLGDGQPLYDIADEPTQKGLRERATDAAKGLAQAARRTGNEIFDQFSEIYKQSPAAAFAVGMDTAGEAIANSPPVRVMRGIFVPEVMGATNVFAQEVGRQHYEAIERTKYLTRQRMFPVIKKLGEFEELNLDKMKKKLGKDKDVEATAMVMENQMAIRNYLEDASPLLNDGERFGPDGASRMLPENLKAIEPELRQMKGYIQELAAIQRESGLKVGTLQDSFISYFPRTKQGLPREVMNSLTNLGRQLDPGNRHQLSRKEFLKDIPGGTTTINRIAMDETFSGIAHKYDNKVVPQEVRDELKQRLINEYGGGDAATKRKDNLFMLEDSTGQLDKFVDWVINLDPRHAAMQIPVFRLDVTTDLLNYAEATMVASGAGNFATSLLAKGARPATAGGVSVEKVVETLAREGMDGKQLDKIVSAKMGDMYTNKYNELQEKYSEIVRSEMERLAQFGDGEIAVMWSSGKDAPKVRIKDGESAGAVGRLAGINPDGTYKFQQMVERTEEVEEAGKMVERTFLDVDELTVRLDEVEANIGPRDVFREFSVDENVDAVFGRYMKGHTNPEAMNEFFGFARSLTNLYKSGLTVVWPAFHVRNFISAMYNNWLAGASDPRHTGPRAYMQTVKDADALLRGKKIEGLLEIPVIKDLGIRNEDEAIDFLKREIFANNLYGPTQGMPGDVVGQDLGGILDAIPGQERSLKDIFLRIPGPPPGASKADAFNPLGAAGVLGDADTFGPYRWGRQVGQHVEGIVRVAPFLAYLRQGVDVQEATRRVMEVQFDYSKLTPTERYAKLLIPFYSYTRNNIPFVAKNLIENPGGKMAQTIRAVTGAQTDEPLPDFIAGTAAIPYPLSQRGSGADGTRSYITGLGLGFEDATSFGTILGGNFSDAFRQGLSRMNPVIKGPLESAFGESTYFDGPGGGRALTDLDPSLGRVRDNIYDLATGSETKGRAAPLFGSETLEQLSANLPTSRLVTTARTLTDKRKLTRPDKMLLNLLTGIKISDVSPQSWDAAVQAKAMERLREMGARDFVRSYIPEYQKDRLTNEELNETEEIQAILTWLATRSKDRKALEEEREILKDSLPKEQ